MYCKQCGYRLWNLPSRTCPECGLPFKPSDFEFTQNSVEFRCPHCSQGYFGTGPTGHLVPPEFECVRCRQRIHMDQMVLLPTAGVDEHRTPAETMPWLDRDRLGQVAGWWRTVKLAMVRPARVMELTPETGATGSALWFATVSTCITYLVFIIPLMGFSIVIAGVGARGGGGALAAAAGTAIMALAPIGGMLAMILIGGAVTHGLLRLTGPTHAGLSRTYQALGFSTGANIASAIPCVGGYIGWTWWLVSAILMVRAGQRVSGLRASFAVLTPPVLVLAALIAWFVWFVTLGPAAFGAAVPPYARGGAGTAVRSRPVFDALRAYADDHDGRGPRHAIELLLGDYAVSPADLFGASPGDPIDLSLHTVGGVPLSDIEALPLDQREAALQSALAALPENVIAHRVGDCVFTYHGMDFRSCDPRLWVLVRLGAHGASTRTVSTTIAINGTNPSAAVSSTQPATAAWFYVAVGADGATQPLYGPSIQSFLAIQNRIRAENKLPPLPDPASVTEDAPAVGVYDPEAAETPPDVDPPPEADDAP